MLKEKYVNMQLLMDISICMIQSITVRFLETESVLFCAIELHQNNGDQSLSLISGFSA